MDTNDDTNDRKPNDAQETVAPEPPAGLLREAEQGDPEAAYQLGKFYLESAPPDVDKAFHWMQRAVELGSPNGLNGLGACYLYGCGVEQNPEKAVELFQQGAEKDVPHAFYNLGQCRYYGWGIKRNVKEGLRLLRRAADKEVVFAVNFLASVYLNSDSKRNRKIAFQYLRTTAEKNLDPDVLHHLALCYLNGWGTKRNDAEAVRLLGLAWSPAMEYQLGWCYLHGRGVEKNLEEANRRFEAAAEMGYAPAEYEWGCSLQAGRGTPKNREEGRHWLIRAAEKDYPWDENAEYQWRFSVFAICCAFCFWIAIPVIGALFLADVVEKVLSNKFTPEIFSRAVSAVVLLAGPVAFWFGVFRSLRFLRWGCVLMVPSGIELASEMCWHWARQPGTSMFNHLPIPLFILVALVSFSLGTCVMTARRTYWLELKRNKREISFWWPVLICSGLYGLSLIARHFFADRI